MYLQRSRENHEGRITMEEKKGRIKGCVAGRGE
jgi:hypothetical protein